MLYIHCYVYLYIFLQHKRIYILVFSLYLERHHIIIIEEGSIEEQRRIGVTVRLRLGALSAGAGYLLST